VSDENKQARFSRRLNHFVLKPEERTRGPRLPKKHKKKGPFPANSKTEYELLAKEISAIYEKSLVRTKIIESPRMHFVMELSDKLTWNPIRESIQRLGVTIVEYLNEKTIRVSIKKDEYPSFLALLENNHKFIQNVREIGLFEKIDKTFYEQIKSSPEEKNFVSIEFSNISGVENVDLIEEALQAWVEKEKVGTLKKSFLSDNMLLFSGFLVNKAIELLVSEMESLSCVAKIPQMELEGFDYGSSLTLSSIVPLEEEKQPHGSPIPIMIIDSGINQHHALLKDHIENTFDYSSRQSGPCLDLKGHGSCVSGLAIYGEDLRKTNIASAKVIMVKNFDIGGEINKDIIEVISETINANRFNSRILNLSFNANGPNVSLTKALDEIVFLSNCVTVVSAGNIGKNTIISYLNSGINYPNYLDNQVVFFPADCRNVLTVGSCTASRSGLVPSNCPAPFTKSGFSNNFVKPEVLASGGNLELSVTANGKVVFEKQGLGILSTSNVDSGYIESVGTSLSSPIVANIVAENLQRRIDLSAFLVKALIISSCDLLNNPHTNGTFSEKIQGFGRVNRLRATDSQDWRACYLLQGEFSSTSPNLYHRYLFLFPQEANLLDVTAVCGKLLTCHNQETSEYIRLFFKRPGLRSATPLKRGVRIGSRKCHCTYRESIKIERGSIGVWRVDVVPHFSTLPLPQKIRYGIVIAVCSTKKADVYSAVEKWIEPQKERLLVPAIMTPPRI
jgi:hypothetical protein